MPQHRPRSVISPRRPPRLPPPRVHPYSSVFVIVPSLRAVFCVFDPDVHVRMLLRTASPLTPPTSVAAGEKKAKKKTDANKKKETKGKEKPSSGPPGPGAGAPGPDDGAATAGAGGGGGRGGPPPCPPHTWTHAGHDKPLTFNFGFFSADCPS